MEIPKFVLWLSSWDLRLVSEDGLSVSWAPKYPEERDCPGSRIYLLQENLYDFLALEARKFKMGC